MWSRGVIVDAINAINRIDFEEFDVEQIQKCYVKTHNTIKIKSVKLSTVKPHFRPLKIPNRKGLLND